MGRLSTKIECTCQHCGKRFYKKASDIKNGGGKYCSRECHNQGRTKRIKRTCLHCGKQFIVCSGVLKYGHGKYCSLECSNNSRKTQVDCTCLQCGKQFKTVPSTIKNGKGKYCSIECKNDSRYTSVECTCAQCGKSFFRTPSQIVDNKTKEMFCSKQCRHAKYNQSHVDRICQSCGKHFTIVASVVAKGKAKYCSRICADKHVDTFSVNCEFCGKEFLATKSKRELGHSKYCSNKCKGMAKRGANHPAWTGGHRYYRGKNWNAQRKLAYERDGGMCQVCHHLPKRGERKNAVHHIRKYRAFDGDYVAANDLSNLITLCQSCHGKAEHGAIPVPKRLL